MSAVTITFFPNAAAQTKREEVLHLPDLAKRIAAATASSKATLPWLKLATFGDLRTADGNSLRHNANVVTISGAEGDYDGETTSFAEAVDTLRTAGVMAIVYTSPSHTEDAPRWRVATPFSVEYPPDRRDAFMARLNGLFSGIFSPESWTLSQSYYYGSVNCSPSQVELIDGTPIDLMHQLDAGAIAKPGTKASGNGAERPTSSSGPYVPASDVRLEAFRLSVLDNLRRQAIDGQKHVALRNAALALGGIQVAAGFTDAEAVQWLLEALPASVEDWNAARTTAAWGLEQGRSRPIVLEDRVNGSSPPIGMRDADHAHGADAAPEPPPAEEDTAEQPHDRASNSAHDPRDLAGFDLTEDGVALAFTVKHKNVLRYCHHTGAWFEWNGSIWRREETKLAFSWARLTCREIARTADKHKATLARAATAAAVERFAQSDRAFAVTSEIWDTDPWLLGTPGGTIDLRTGMQQPTRPQDYITKATAVVPGEQRECPAWLAFVRQATGGEKAFARFLQQWCGYCLTGITQEHALLFVYGPGGNGKSVFLNTVSGILGDYCRTAPMDTFTAAHGDRHPTDLAMLRGARLVTATETEEGRAWAEARIKQMTGGDPITARFMRQDFFTFCRSSSSPSRATTSRPSETWTMRHAAASTSRRSCTLRRRSICSLRRSCEPSGPASSAG